MSALLCQLAAGLRECGLMAKSAIGHLMHIIQKPEQSGPIALKVCWQYYEFVHA